MHRQLAGPVAILVLLWGCSSQESTESDAAVDAPETTLDAGGEVDPLRRQNYDSPGLRLVYAEGGEALPPGDGEQDSLIFEENLGQVEGSAVFLARGPDYSVFIEPGRVTLGVVAFEGSELDEPVLGIVSRDSVVHYVSMVFEASGGEATAVGENPVNRVSDYLKGPDAEQWTVDVQAFSRVRVDDASRDGLVSFGGGFGRLEVFFTVPPGGDLDELAFAFPETDRVVLNEAGQVVVEFSGGELVAIGPEAFQDLDDGRVAVPAGVNFRDDEYLGIWLGEHDTEQPVTVKQTLVLAGTTSGSPPDRVWAVSGTGRIAVVGETASLQQPDDIASGDVAVPAGDVLDGMLAVVDRVGQPDESTHVSIVGAAGLDGLRAVGFDSAGRVIAVGSTESDGDTGLDAVAVRLPLDRFEPEFMTIFGGEGREVTRGLTVTDDDLPLPILIVGETTSAVVPAGIVEGAYSGGTDAFVAQLDQEGVLGSFRFVGGAGDDAAWAVGADATGAVYVVGHTSGGDFRDTNGDPIVPLGGVDVFLVRYDVDGELDLAELFGTTADDYATDLVVDPTGGVAICGLTVTDDDDTGPPEVESYVARMDQAGEQVFWTVLNGRGTDRAFAVHMTPDRRLWVGGQTESDDFVVTEPMDRLPEGENGFLTEINPDTGAMHFSMVLGGRGHDSVLGISGDDDRVVLTGASDSLDFVSIAEMSVHKPIRIGSAYVLTIDPPEARLPENDAPDAIISTPSPDDTFTLGCGYIQLDGSLSTDSDGEIVSYEWLVEPPGGFEAIPFTGVVQAYVPMIAGEHLVSLTVTDDDDVPDTETITITVVEIGGAVEVSRVTVVPPESSGGDPMVEMRVGNFGTMELLSTTITVHFDADDDGDVDPAETVFERTVGGLARGESMTDSFAPTGIPTGLYTLRITIDPGGEVFACPMAMTFEQNDVLVDLLAPEAEMTTPLHLSTVEERYPLFTITHADGHSGTDTSSLVAQIARTSGIDFGEGSALPSGTQTLALATAELDGNEHPDLLTASADKFAVYLGQGDGTFSEWTSTIGVTLTAIALGDLGGTGDIDVALADRASQQIYVLLGEGAGVFSTAVPGSMSVGCGVDAVAIGDVTDSFGNEIVATCGTNFDFYLFERADEGSPWVRTTLLWGDWSGTPTAPVSVDTANLNGSGLDEVVVGAAGRVVVLSYNAGGDPLFNSNAITGGSYPWPALGDLNGDMVPDLVIVDGNGTNAWSRLGDGSGGFDATSWSPTAPGSEVLNPLLARVDQDEHLDLVIPSKTAGVVIYAGHGDGSFDTDPVITSIGRVPWDVAVLDANGDNNNDILIADQSPASAASGTALLLNTGWRYSNVLVVTEQDADHTILQPRDPIFDGDYDVTFSVRDFWLNEASGGGSFTVAVP